MTIHMAQFGLGGPVIRLTNVSGINGFEISPTDSYAGVRINADGTVDKREDATFTQVHANSDWIIPNSAASSAYSVRCTNNGDALAAGSAATGSWLNLGTTRLWYVEFTGVFGSTSLDITIEISNDGGTTILDSANYTGTAAVEP